MTDEKALREKLDAMLKAYPCGDWVDRIEAVALDLLRRLEERETPCVWEKVLTHWGGSCGETDWRDPGPEGASYKFCPGCGHPVQVKQNEEE